MRSNERTFRCVVDTGSKTIGIVSSYYLPHLGGVEQYTDGLATALAAQGHRVIVLTCAVTAEPGIERREDGVEICRIPAQNMKDRLPLPKSGFKSSGAWRYAASVSYDGIIVNTRLYPLSLHGVQLACEKGITPVVIEHGSGELSVGNAVVDVAFHRYEHRLFKRIAAHGPRWCGVSQKAAEWLSDLGVKAEGVIPNAIGAEAFRSQASGRDFRSELGIAENAPLVAFTGRLIREKGVWTFAEVAAFLKGRTSDAHFVIAGEGPERARLEGEIGANVHLVGRLERSDVSALLQQADVFCFPSMYPEGLPTSLLEAAVSRAYIISSDVAGACDVIPDESCGTVLADASAERFAHAVQVALDSPEEARQAAKNCCAHVEQHLSWEASAAAALGICLR